MGSSRFAVLSGLVTAIAGDASTLEDEAARGAVLDVLEAIYPGELEDFEDLASIELDEAGVNQVLVQYLAAYIYRRLLPALAAKFAELEDPRRQKRLDSELREQIQLIVRLDLKGKDAIGLNWQGEEGKAVVGRALAFAYAQMELFAE